MVDDKMYFTPGQLVTVKLNLENKPVMLVVKKETSIFKHDSKNPTDKKPTLLGIRCRWFTTTGELLEAVFSTKDLELVEDVVANTDYDYSNSSYSY